MNLERDARLRQALALEPPRAKPAAPALSPEVAAETAPLTERRLDTIFPGASSSDRPAAVPGLIDELRDGAFAAAAAFQEERDAPAPDAEKEAVAFDDDRRSVEYVASASSASEVVIVADPLAEAAAPRPVEDVEHTAPGDV